MRRIFGWVVNYAINASVIDVGLYTGEEFVVAAGGVY